MAGTVGALTKDNPARYKRDSTIASYRAAGLTMRQIADKMGLDKATICHVINDDDIKPLIEQEAKVLLGLVPRAVDVVRETLDGEDNKLKYQASKDVLQSTGILPSHTQAVIIQNSFNQTNVELTPEVLSLLQSRPPASQIIDCNLDLDGDGD